MSALGVSIHFFTAKVLLPISLGHKMFVEDFDKEVLKLTLFEPVTNRLDCIQRNIVNNIAKDTRLIHEKFTLMY